MCTGSYLPPWVWKGDAQTQIRAPPLRNSLAVRSWMVEIIVEDEITRLEGSGVNIPFLCFTAA
jgi:hypothetical protein